MRRTISNDHEEEYEGDDGGYSYGGSGGFMGRGNKSILSRVGDGEVKSITIENLNYEINEDDLTELFETVSCIVTL